MCIINDNDNDDVNENNSMQGYDNLVSMIMIDNTRTDKNDNNSRVINVVLSGRCSAVVTAKNAILNMAFVSRRKVLRLFCSPILCLFRV